MYLPSKSALASITLMTLLLGPFIFIFNATISPPNYAILDALRLGDVIANTYWVVLGVGLIASCLGIGLAYLFTFYTFPLKNWLMAGLILPVTIPAYVSAFIYKGILNRFPLFSLIIVLSLSLYPYAFLLVKNGMESLAKKQFAVAQSLGLSPIQVALRVVLPQCRPWLGAAAALICLETLADFGAASVFNIKTASVAIHQAWFTYFSIGTAAKISGILILIVIAFLGCEQYARKQQRVVNPYQSDGPVPLEALTGSKRIVAMVTLLIPLLAGFIIPVATLTIWSLSQHNKGSLFGILPLLTNTIILAGIAAFSAVFVGAIIAYLKRIRNTPYTTMAGQLTLIGYGIPGAIVAIAFFMAFKQMESWMPFGYWVSTSIIVLVSALLLRFLVLSFRSVLSAYQRINPRIDESAQSLGKNYWQLFKQLHIPNLTPALSLAFVLIFLEVIKEMPITLMTRPLGWDTLSVKIFELTSEGDWERAALPALLLILIGLIPLPWIRDKASHEHLT